MKLIDADALKKEFPKDTDWEYPTNTNEYVCEKIDAQPAVQPETNCSEIPNNSDTISRQQAIDALDEQIEQCEKALYNWLPEKDRYAVKVEKASLTAYREKLKYLPSVQPERKTGHWIKTARWGRVYYCDQCRNYLDFDGVNAGRGSTNFCPNCGADMRGGEQNGMEK